MKHKTIAANQPHNGAYVCVYQRPGEKPLADLAYYDGVRSIRELENLQEALGKAISLMRDWEKKK